MMLLKLKRTFSLPCGGDEGRIPLTGNFTTVTKINTASTIQALLLMTERPLDRTARGEDESV